MLLVRNELAVPIEVAVVLPSRRVNLQLLGPHDSSDESEYFFTLPEILKNAEVKYRPVLISSTVKADFQPLGRLRHLARGELQCGSNSKVTELGQDVNQTCSLFKKLNFYSVADLRTEEHGGRLLSIVPSCRIHNLVPVPIQVCVTNVELMNTPPSQMTVGPAKYAMVGEAGRLRKHRTNCRLQVALPSVGLRDLSEGDNRLDLTGNSKGAITLTDGKGGELHVLMEIEDTRKDAKHLSIVLYVRCCLVNRTGLQFDLGSSYKIFGRKKMLDFAIHGRNSTTLKQFASQSSDIFQQTASNSGSAFGDEQIVLLSPSEWKKKELILRLRLKGSSSWSEKMQIDRFKQTGVVVVEGSYSLYSYLSFTS